MIIPSLFFVILTHEYQIFSLSLHFLISLGVVKKEKKIKDLLKTYSFLIISIFLVIFFFGNQDQFKILNEILIKFNVELNPYLGVVCTTISEGFINGIFFILLIEIL